MGVLPWLAVLLLFHSGPVKQTVDVVNEINQITEEKRNIGKVTVEHWYSPHDHTVYGIDDEEIIENGISSGHEIESQYGYTHPES